MSSMRPHVDLVARSPSLGTPFPVDIYADNQHTYLRAELPGVDPASIVVHPLDGLLTVFARTPAIGPADQASGQLFSRQVHMPGCCGASIDLVRAHYANGILGLILSRPTHPEDRPGDVPIN